MDPALKTSMLTYYDERAAEYDDLYRLGKAPAAKIDREVYLEEVDRLAEVARSRLTGAVLDAPCGAGYWMLSYAGSCDSITLIDRSAKMLAESRAKARTLGVLDRVDLIEADLLGYELPPSRYDSVLVGFLLGHLTDAEMDTLMASLRRTCRPGATVVIFESHWSAARQRIRDKAGPQRRRLKDGRQFDIYKRYFDEQDLAAFGARFGLPLEIVHEGQAYIAACGQFCVTPVASL
jgi:ubiquinone/menaquinone biosynthesis C-methylase UbiE